MHSIPCKGVHVLQLVCLLQVYTCIIYTLQYLFLKLIFEAHILNTVYRCVTPHIKIKTCFGDWYTLSGFSLQYTIRKSFFLWFEAKILCFVTYHIDYWFWSSKRSVDEESNGSLPSAGILVYIDYIRHWYLPVFPSLSPSIQLPTRKAMHGYMY